MTNAKKFLASDRIRGKLWVFEGPDGVGKSTLATGLRDYFAKKGSEFEMFSFPGRETGTLGSHIYDLHHNWAQLGIKSMNPASLQILHVAAHIDCIESSIIPALRCGRNIILDRYWWSTWVYGLVSGVSQISVEAMVKLECVHWGGILPNALFLIQSPFPHRKDVKDRSWRDLIHGYEDLMHREKGQYPIHLIDGSMSLNDTMERVIGVVQESG